MLKNGTQAMQKNVAPAESILKRPSLPKAVKERLDSPGGPKLKVDEGRIVPLIG